MDKIHKEALRKTRSKIVRDLNIESEIWDLLQERNIFTSIMLEYIQAEKTKTAKVRKLLDDLIRRGPKAYHEFIHCLRESGHGHIANEILKSEQEVSRGSSEIPGGVQTASDVSVVRETQPSRQSTEEMDVSDAVPTPEDGVNNAYPARPNRHIAQPEDDNHLVTTVGLSDASDRPPSGYHQGDQRRTYTMESDPRGHCLIINNRRFERMDERVGTDKNRDDLQQLFTDLGYQVAVHNDLTAQDMQACIIKFGVFEGLSVVDAVAVILLSHGDNQLIYGTDGMALDLNDEIFAPFARNAIGAINKPKIFIVNACRGDRDDSGINHDGRGSESNVILYSDAIGDLPRCSTDGRCTPTLKDFYIAYSTFGGFASYRTDAGGSKFIEIMVEVFREEAATYDINTMMTEINRRMAEWVLVNQIPSPTHTLTKALYFNPPAKTWSHLV